MKQSVKLPWTKPPSFHIYIYIYIYWLVGGCDPEGKPPSVGRCVHGAMPPLYCRYTGDQNHRKSIAVPGISSGRFGQLERVLLRGSGPYFCGQGMTTCDLSFYCIATGLRDGSFCDGVSPNVLAATPALLALVDKIASHPQVADWNARGGNGGLWPPGA